MLAFVCPGQGSQSVGMAQDLYEQYPVARELFDEVAAGVDFPLLPTMFDGPADALTATENAQPALVAHSLAVAAVLQAEGIEPQMVAGHSLGEYAALAIAGVFTAADAVRLVRKRGLLMAEAGREVGGTMAAIIGLEESALCEALAQVSEGIVGIANFNSEDQTVISGEVEAVRAAGELATQAGARRVIPLQVSGAFHSPLMQSAAEQLTEALAQVEFADATVPVITNCDAAAHTDADELKQGLVRQLTHTVLWRQSVATMTEAGADAFIEVGAGTVLSKMMQRSRIDARIYNSANVDALRNSVIELGGLKPTQ